MTERVHTSLRLTTEPAIEPISLADAKLHLKVDDDFTEDDLKIQAIVAAVRQSAEDFQGRAFITQVWTLTLDEFPGYRSDWPSFRPQNGEWRIIRIPRPPLQQINSIKYLGRTAALDSSIDSAFDAVSGLHTMKPELYQVDAMSQPARVAPVPAIFWPLTALSLLSPALGSVQVEFKAGYGDTADKVPARTVAGMLLALGHLYQNREGVVVSGSRAIAIEVPQGIKDLFWGDRIVEFA